MKSFHLQECVFLRTPGHGHYSQKWLLTSFGRRNAFICVNVCEEGHQTRYYIHSIELFPRDMEEFIRCFVSSKNIKGSTKKTYDKWKSYHNVLERGAQFDLKYDRVLWNAFLKQNRFNRVSKLHLIFPLKLCINFSAVKQKCTMLKITH